MCASLRHDKIGHQTPLDSLKPRSTVPDRLPDDPGGQQNDFKQEIRQEHTVIISTKGGCSGTVDAFLGVVFLVATLVDIMCDWIWGA